VKIIGMLKDLLATHTNIIPAYQPEPSVVVAPVVGLAVLDKSRDYATCFGPTVAMYEQDGKYFGADGVEIKE
jgi:hypothetical protein